MPCDTITTVSVALGKVDMVLLEKALNVLYPNSVYRSGPEMIRFGINEYYDKQAQSLAVRTQDQVAQIKRAYSAEVVKSQARKYGWTLKETAPFQYQITKR
jgi:hypothetical protein